MRAEKTQEMDTANSHLNNLDPTSLAQRVLNETVQQRYALEVMQRESIRSLKERQFLRDEDAHSQQNAAHDTKRAVALESDISETPPPLPTGPPPQDERDCSTPTSTSSHFTLPPNPSSALPYSATTTSSKPVASVLPSVYAGSRTFTQREDSGQRSDKTEFKPKPPLPAKPKSVTFSDSVKSKSNPSSPQKEEDSAKKSVNGDGIAVSSVKKLTSKFEQQSSSNNAKGADDSASRFITPRGYQPPPPYPGHRPRQAQPPSHTSLQKNTNGPQHISQSSMGSDQSTVSTISESSSVLAERQVTRMEEFDSHRNWYDSDSESLASLPPVSSDSHATSSRYGRGDGHGEINDASLSVPAFAQADKIRSIYQSQNGYTSSAFRSRDTVDVVSAPDLPGYSQEAGYFGDSGEVTFPSSSQPMGYSYPNHSQPSVAYHHSDAVYQNLPEVNGGASFPQNEGGNFRKGHPPPPPVRTASRNLSHFQSHLNEPPAHFMPSPSQANHVPSRTNADQRTIPGSNADNTAPGRTAGGVAAWKGAPPPYHAAVSISKLRGGGVPSGNQSSGQYNQTNNERSAFTTTLHVSKC